MSNEIHTDYPSGSTLYAVVRASGGNVWYASGEKFEGWGTAGRTASSYAVALTDRGGSRYEADFPTAIPAGYYVVQIFLQSGGTPSALDVIMGGDQFQWTGTARVTEVSVLPAGDVGLAKDDVIMFVNNVLHLIETNMDLEIQTVLDDLSQGPYLHAVDEGQTLTNTSTRLAVPTAYHCLNSIVLNDGSVDLKPLKPLRGGYKEYRRLVADYELNIVSHPQWHTEYGGYFWPYPKPGQTYTARIDYYKRHAQDVNNIEFSLEWKRALNFGVCFEMAVKKKMLDQVQIWGARYQAEKRKQELMHPGLPHVSTK